MTELKIDKKNLSKNKLKLIKIEWHSYKSLAARLVYFLDTGQLGEQYPHLR